MNIQDYRSLSKQGTDWTLAFQAAVAALEGVTLRDVTVEMTKDGAAGYPAMMDGCPEMRGAGFFLRNARQVTFSDVRVLGVQGEEWNIDDSVEVCR